MIRVEKSPWSDEAAAHLAAAVIHVSVSELAAQVAAGAVLFRVSDDVGLIGFYVLRVDHTADGAEGVLVAASGRAGFDITATLVPHVERQFIGCKTMRVHTSRPGMARKLARQGYAGAEIILRKSLC